jgi:peroxiredoxin
MKIKLIPIILFFALFSCKQRKHETMICGQIDGYNEKPIHLFSTESIFNGKPFGQSKASSYTNQQGQFCITVAERDTGFYHLVLDDGELLVETPILLSRGDSIHIKTSVYNSLKPIFGGTNEVFNNFIVDVRQSLSLAFRRIHINKKEENSFVSFADSIHQRYKTSIDSLHSLKCIKQIGFNILNTELDLYIASKKYEYLRYHIYETQAEWEYFKPQISFYSFANGLIDRTSRFWFIPEYPQMLEYMIEDELQKNENLASSKNSFGKIIDIIDNNFSGIAKEVALGRLSRNLTKHLSDPIFFQELQKIDSLMNSISTKPSIKEYFTSQIKKIEAIKPGNPAPKFTLPDKDGNHISIRSLKGKVVLLVFWGTWCPPCLSSIPKYIELQKKFQETEIAFVFVSLEARKSDVEGWKDFIQGKGEIAADLLNGKEFPGIHLVAKGQFQNPEIQPYVITYAPSYVLIDSNGQIAYPRVDLNDELVKKIEELVSNP